MAEAVVNKLLVLTGIAVIVVVGPEPLVTCIPEPACIWVTPPPLDPVSTVKLNCDPSPLVKVIVFKDIEAVLNKLPVLTGIAVIVAFGPNPLVTCIPEPALIWVTPTPPPPEPVSIVIGNVVPSPLVNVIVFKDTEAVLNKLPVLVGVAVITTLPVVGDTWIPTPVTLVTPPFKAYDAVVAKLELATNEAVIA